MPVMSCRVKGRPGFKWGASGKCYTYANSNRASREAARQKALAQGRAIEANTQSFIRADLQHMAQSEIESMVPQATLDRIKQTDPEPLFKVFSVGHEGTATPTMVGLGTIAVQYFKDAIRKISAKIVPGLKVFNRHAATNDHAGRTQVGEVVASTLQNIKDTLHSVAAVYIYPKHKDDGHNIASIETNLVCREEGGKAVAVDVNNVTGIALSREGVDVPGFPGATLLGAFQAFSDTLLKEREGTMTLDEIQAAIQEGGFTPSDLFDTNTLKSDPGVVQLVRAANKTEYEHAKQVEERLGKKLDAAEERYSALRKSSLSGRAKTVLSDMTTERKLTDAQRGFIDRNMSRFESDADDDSGLQKDLSAFVDSQLSDFEEVSKLLGVAGTEGQGEGGEGKGGGDAGGSAGKGDGGAPKTGDMTDPDVNPLIPGGKADAAAV